MADLVCGACGAHVRTIMKMTKNPTVTYECTGCGKKRRDRSTAGKVVVSMEGDDQVRSQPSETAIDDRIRDLIAQGRLRDGEGRYLEFWEE